MTLSNESCEGGCARSAIRGVSAPVQLGAGAVAAVVLAHFVVDFYAGYTAPKGNFFTQAIGNGVSRGFSFADYMSFVDTGAVLMIQVRGHSMFGYGYDAATASVILHDTWSQSKQSMPWGGSYAGMELWGVTVLEPAGGGSPVPEPCTLALLGSGLAGAVRVRLRRRALVRGQRLRSPLPARR